MTWLSLLRYASIERVIRHYVRWASEDAELIVLNMRRYASTTGKDSYLIQRFLLEQMNVVARGLLRRQFCHQEHDLPRTIHPLLWFLGWLIAIAGALFFIIWILFWGTNNDGSSILNWGVNLALHLIAEIFLIALIRILIVNVLLVDLLRPFLQSAYSWFKRLPSDRDILQKRAFRRASVYPNQTDDGMGTISIYQHISPVCIASRYPEFEDLSSSKTICNIQDVDMLHLQRSSGGEEVYAMDEKDVTGRTQQTRGSTHGIFDMVRENHPQNPSNLPSAHEELEAGRN